MHSSHLFAVAVISDTLSLTGGFAFIAAFIAFMFWRSWKAFKPIGVASCWGMLLCMAIVAVCVWNTTWPSSAPRVQLRGTLSSVIEHNSGRYSTYSLTVLDNEGQMHFLDSPMTPLFFAEGHSVDITYLDEKVSGGNPRAIRIRALDGPRAGEESSVNADWLGPWIGVPLAVAGALYCIFTAARYRREKPAGEQRPAEVTSLGL